MFYPTTKLGSLNCLSAQYKRALYVYSYRSEGFKTKLNSEEKKNILLIKQTDDAHVIELKRQIAVTISSLDCMEDPGIMIMKQVLDQASALEHKHQIDSLNIISSKKAVTLFCRSLERQLHQVINFSNYYHKKNPQEPVLNAIEWWRRYQNDTAQNSKK